MSVLAETRTRENPYVGPRPFETGEPLYGRDDELYRLVNLLIAKRIVLLYSPSGAGKTSLIQAGLIPRLRVEGFNVLPVIRVNLDLPADELPPTANRYVVSTVSSLDRPLPPSEQVSLADVAGMDLPTYLDRRPRAKEGRTYDVLIFDQFEELLTLDPTDQPAKQAFMEQVGEVLRDRHRWALFSMREEFIAGLEPYLRSIPTRLSTTFRLDLLTETAARAAMQSPASESGVTFSDAAARLLVDELRRTRVQRSDGAREELGPYVEPVQLQVVCRQLWERLPADVSEISESHVLDFGDVNTALAGYYVERIRAVAENTGVSERAIRDWFDHITEQGFRIQVLSGPDGDGGRDQEVLDALQSAHLIRAEQRRGATWYELAHDRLIAPVRESNAAWRESTLSPFQRAAVLWNQYDRSDAFLLTDEALAGAEPSLSDDAGVLTQVERDFLAANQRARDERARARRQERRIRRLAVTASLVSVVALIAFGLALNSSHHARHQTRLAQARELVTVAESTASADPSLRTLLSLEAVNQAGSGDEPIVMDARQSLYEALYHSKPAPLFTLPTTGAVMVAATPDGRRIATAGYGAGHRQVEIWDVETKNGPWTGAPDPVTVPNTIELSSIALSSDGKTLATAGADGKGRLWDVVSPEKHPVELAHADESANYGPTTERLTERTKKWLWTVALSDDGHRVVTVGEDGFAHVWSTAGEPVDSPSNKFGIIAAAFNPQNSNQIALANRTGSIVLWDTDQGEDIRYFGGHTSAVLSLAFDSTGTRLASAADSGWLTLHDVASGALLRHLRHPEAVNDLRHEHRVNTVAFSSSGDRLATGGEDGRAVVWDLESGHRVAVFEYDDRPVRSVAFRGDDELVVAADDAAPGVWEVPRNPPEGHRLGIGAVALSPDNGRLVTASADETAKIWDFSSGEELFTLPHTGKVYAASVNHDGTRVVTASSDATARLWDASTGKELFELRHGGEVTVAEFSPDGGRVITAADDRTAKLWDALTGDELFTLPHGDWVRRASFSPDGRQVLTASHDATAKLWEPSTGKELFSLPHESAVLSTAWAPNGRFVATGADDGSVNVWDTASGERLPWPVESGHVRKVNAITFSPDGTRLLTGSADNTARVWEVVTGKELLPRLDHDGEVADVVFSPNGNIIATAGTDWLARLWDAGSGKQTAWLNHDGALRDVLFSSGGGELLTAGDGNNARSWDTPSGSARSTFGSSPFRHSAEVSDIEFSPDGQTLGTASDDGTVTLWAASRSLGFRRHHDSSDTPGVLWGVSAGTDARTMTGHSGRVIEIGFSPEGDQLATASQDRTAKIWDIASETALYTLTHADIVSDVAFSPDGTVVATASQDRTAKLWDRQGNELHELRHDDVINSVNFSPDGKRVATASDDRTVRVWDVTDGRQVGESLAHEAPAYEVVFSEDGRIMATASGASVRIWSTRNLRRPTRTLRTGSEESKEGVEILNLAFSEDGALLAAGTADGIALWDVGGKRTAPFLRVPQAGDDRSVGFDVRAVSFSPDGKRLAAAGAGKEFYVYELDPERLRTMALELAGRSLSAAECKRYISPDGC